MKRAMGNLLAFFGLLVLFVEIFLPLIGVAPGTNVLSVFFGLAFVVVGYYMARPKPKEPPTPSAS